MIAPYNHEYGKSSAYCTEITEIIVNKACESLLLYMKPSTRGRSTDPL